MMTKVGEVVLNNETFDLAIGTGSTDGQVALARTGLDLYDRPVASPVDLESELLAGGNVCWAEQLLLLLAKAYQERDAALTAARKVES